MLHRNKGMLAFSIINEKHPSGAILKVGHKKLQFNLNIHILNQPQLLEPDLTSKQAQLINRNNRKTTKVMRSCMQRAKGLSGDASFYLCPSSKFCTAKG